MAGGARNSRGGGGGRGSDSSSSSNIRSSGSVRSSTSSRNFLTTLRDSVAAFLGAPLPTKQETPDADFTEHEYDFPSASSFSKGASGAVPAFVPSGTSKMPNVVNDILIISEDSLVQLSQNVVVKEAFATGRRWAPVIEMVTLGVIAVLAFLIRLFAVIRFESVIHEFDPYFNYRTTNYLAAHGFAEFWNWFDDQSWYPLGRVIGHTLFPGLMTTTAVLQHALHSIGFTVNTRNLCVFMGPTFSMLTAISAYGFTKEVTAKPEAGLVAAFFMAICPSYLSRSVAGSYDNECVAIFALIFGFWTFVKAVRYGTLSHSLMATFAYLYMVSTWGGYVFLTNTIAIYVFCLLCLDRLNGNAYVVYCTWYVVGTMFVLNIPFVNFGAVKSSEHMASHGIFMLCHAYKLSKYLIQQKADLEKGAPRLFVVTKDSALSFRIFAFLFSARGMVTLAGAGFSLLTVYLVFTGKTQWSGRSMTLLDPTYARNYIPIIASVSEHQPAVWTNYVMDLHAMVFLIPAGMFHCFWNRSYGLLFVGVFGLLSTYFSGVMIRLLLVMSPACCCLSGISLSHVLTIFTTNLRHMEPPAGTAKHLKVVSLSVLGFAAFIMSRYVMHCTMISSTAYSSPSIVMAYQGRDGTRILQDDFREAYYWIRQNTHKKATIASWWDYGYQITVMANRTVIVDNNTWNNTHIATMGLILGSTEAEAYRLLRTLDADYVLVLSGSLSRYSSDDINKFLWPVRIAAGVYPDLISEADFIGPGGYTPGPGASEKFIDSLIYKLAFHRVGELTNGVDLARGVQLAKPDITLTHFQEVFTSENWIVRLFKLKKESNRVKF